MNKVYEFLTEEKWCQGSLYIDKDGYATENPYQAVKYSLWGAILIRYRDNFTWAFMGMPNEYGDDLVAHLMRECLKSEFGLTDFQEFNDKSDFKTIHDFCIRNSI